MSLAGLSGGTLLCRLDAIADNGCIDVHLGVAESTERVFVVRSGRHAWAYVNRCDDGERAIVAELYRRCFAEAFAAAPVTRNSADLQAWRGRLDTVAIRARFSDADLHRRLAPDDEMSRR